MIWLLACAMIWLLACAPQQRDQDRYIASTIAARAEAADLCIDIADDTLRADCLIHAAARHARAADIGTAQDTCRRIDAGLWQDECWFLTADDAALIGAEALEACQRSGRFEPHCRGHALGRAALSVDFTVGRESESAKALGTLVTQYRTRSRGQKRRSMANELLMIQVGNRWSTAPFHPDECGVLPEPLCAWAYRASLDGTDTSLGSLCPGPVTSEAVRRIGLSGWEPAGEPIARAVWTAICQQVADGLPVDLKPAVLPGEMMPVD